ncbi:DUSP3 protein [Salpingoeca rosetta]|uniref:protein-serine/threonine phosphatase n=1 Tax=Salpingoeca rosetta (strain ATCC 50818 / BSB-021) TaxID=946362 RepID=F2U4G9_SALR5|nr:DUSP3 protein [Salpingoeca rosetta]EGD82535.1 DUSP3 protein [Salpingoeca rosetta]|eukprot:XP_004995771.1 DUSP3 protein [Salpingoeca rosetta]
MSTVEELQTLLNGDGAVLMPSRSKDEVWPRLWVSEAGPAKDPAGLKESGFTHVLNCSQGTGFGRLNTDDSFYSQHGLSFHGLSVADSARSNLMVFFEEACAFIHDSMSRDDGVVLVHCMEGFSRSPSIAAAYLIKHHNMTAAEALTHIRAKREVFPNEGFLKQLLQWQETIQQASSEKDSA